MMYLHEVLSDVRAWLALSIFAAGWAFGLVWSFIFWLIDKNRGKGKHELRQKQGNRPRRK